MCKATSGSSINELFKQLTEVRGQFPSNFSGICASVISVLNKILKLLVFTGALLNCLLCAVVKNYQSPLNTNQYNEQNYHLKIVGYYSNLKKTFLI